MSRGRFTCAFAGMGQGISCSKRSNLHHIVPQSAIKARYPKGAVRLTDGHHVPEGGGNIRARTPGLAEIHLGLILKDGRNLLRVCPAHHKAFHAALFSVPLDALPAAAAAIEFAEAYGLRDVLDRMHPERRVA